MSAELYTDKATIENYIMKTIDDSFDVQLDAWIMAMSRFIDKFCNRVIFDTESSTMKYDGDNSNSLLIKNTIEIETVTLNDVSISPLQYPANEESKTELRLENGVFTKGMQNVLVTGIVSVSEELPKDIEVACTVLVAGIINNQILNDKAGTTEKIGNYSVTYNTETQRQDFQTAMATLKQYRKLAI